MTLTELRISLVPVQVVPFLRLVSEFREKFRREKEKMKTSTTTVQAVQHAIFTELFLIKHH